MSTTLHLGGGVGGGVVHYGEHYDMTALYGEAALIRSTL